MTYVHQKKRVRCIQLLLLPLLVLITQAAHAVTAADVALSGIINNKVIIYLENMSPRTLGIGETYRDIKLLSIQGTNATFSLMHEGEAQVITLPVGHNVTRLSSQPTRSVVTSCTSPTKIVLNVGKWNRFWTDGYINESSQSLPFLIDTGAAYVVIPESIAKQLDIPYDKNDFYYGSTSSGKQIRYNIQLKSVRIGSITLENVKGAVGGNRKYILIGNSFLRHLNLDISPKTMIIEKPC